MPLKKQDAQVFGLQEDDEFLDSKSRREGQFKQEATEVTVEGMARVLSPFPLRFPVHYFFPFLVGTAVLAAVTFRGRTRKEM